MSQSCGIELQLSGDDGEMMETTSASAIEWGIPRFLIRQPSYSGLWLVVFTSRTIRSPCAAAAAAPSAARQPSCPAL